MSATRARCRSRTSSSAPGLTAIKDRDEYLKKQAEVQFACREDEMVAKVRELLARHNVSWD